MRWGVRFAVGWGWALVPVGVFRVAPLSGETTWSFVSRVAGCYGLDADALAGRWRWVNHRPRHGSGARRADAETVLDTAGRQTSAQVCRHLSGDLSRGVEFLDRALWRTAVAALKPMLSYVAYDFEYDK